MHIVLDLWCNLLCTSLYFYNHLALLLMIVIHSSSEHVAGILWKSILLDESNKTHMILYWFDDKY